MDKNKIRRLAGIETLSEKKWSGDVAAKKHSPEGLFADGSAAEIAKWLRSSHPAFRSAMSALNFYINRAGTGLSASRKEELEKAKMQLRKAFGVTEESTDLSQLRKIAGLPVVEASEEQEDECESSEEPEESAEESKEELLKSLTAAAEGKTGDDLHQIMMQVYDAGVADGREEGEKMKESANVPFLDRQAQQYMSTNMSDERAANIIFNKIKDDKSIRNFSDILKYVRMAMAEMPKNQMDIKDVASLVHDRMVDSGKMSLGEDLHADATSDEPIFKVEVTLLDAHGNEETHVVNMQAQDEDSAESAAKDRFVSTGKKLKSVVSLGKSKIQPR
jgi:hypothetical protein